MAKFKYVGEEPRYLAGETRQTGDEFEGHDADEDEALRAIPGVEEVVEPGTDGEEHGTVQIPGAEDVPF